MPLDPDRVTVSDRSFASHVPPWNTDAEWQIEREQLKRVSDLQRRHAEAFPPPQAPLPPPEPRHEPEPPNTDFLQPDDEPDVDGSEILTRAEVAQIALEQIPAPLRFITPRNANEYWSGNDATLKLSGDDGNVYLGEDQYVRIDSNAVPGHLGNADTNGVLRTDSTISYRDGGDYVTLGVDTANIVNVINNYDSLYITNITPGNSNGDMLYWSASDTAWKILEAPATHAVLCFDPTDTTYGGLVWRTADADYKVLQRKADDTIDFDWVRAHA